MQNFLIGFFAIVAGFILAFPGFFDAFFWFSKECKKNQKFFNWLLYISQDKINKRQSYIELYGRCWDLQKKEVYRLQVDNLWLESKISNNIVTDEQKRTIDEFLRIFEREFVLKFQKSLVKNDSSVLDWFDANKTRLEDDDTTAAFFLFLSATQEIFYEIVGIHEDCLRVDNMEEDDPERKRLSWNISNRMKTLIEQELYHGIIDKLR